ncbi:LIC10415 family protein [Leptospira ilyithenensis]|nr:hypothetical protein [Leptospira ilyithenensis]
MKWGHNPIIKEGKDMDVRLNRLLNSAERFVQDKKEVKDTNSSGANASAKASETKSDFAVSLPVQYHNIQSKLTELQKQLSREQSRMSFLEDNNTKQEDLIHILFENEPLFPELANAEGNFSKKDSLAATQSGIRALVEELKKKEVEGENIFSLGMMHSPEEFKGKMGDVSPYAQKPLSETIVKRLLGG